MKIKVNREQLYEALSNLQRAVTPRSSLPILEGVLLSAETDRLTMMAYNMEISIKKELPVQCEKEGDIVISAKILFDIIRKVPGSVIEIDVDDRQVCHISSGGSVFDIMGMKSEDFPEMPTVSENNSIMMSSDLLKSMVRQTIFATSQKEETRPVLTGIKFEIENGKIKLVAINGNCLAIRKADIDYEGKMEFIVSGRAIGEAVKIIGEEDKNIKINIGARNISFNIDGYIMTSRLIEGSFIEYTRSIPLSHKQQIKVNVPTLIETLERISLVIVNDQTKTPIRCSMEKDKIQFTCSSSVGRSNDVYLTDLEGDEFEIGFSSKYLLDALKATESEEVIIKFNGSSAAAALYPTEGDEFLYLVMPMLLK